MPVNAFAMLLIRGWPDDSRTPSVWAMRRRHELRIGDRGEADEVHRPFECRPRCNLEGKPALPGATRPGDRDEPNVLAGKQARDLRQIALSADKPVVQSGKGRPAQGLQRRKRLCQTRRDELKDRLRARDVLEPVATERAERQTCERLGAYELTDRL